MSMAMKLLAQILLAAAFCLSLQVRAAAPADVPVDADAPPVGVVPRYVLQGPGGGPVTDSDFRGRFQLIAFGYTYCPDVCPTTLVEVAQILKRLGSDASRLQALFVSVDPERDTPTILKAYTGFFDARIIGLTGSPQLLRRVADLFKVRYEIVREPGRRPASMPLTIPPACICSDRTAASSSSSVTAPPRMTSPSASAA